MRRGRQSRAAWLGEKKVKSPFDTSLLPDGSALTGDESIIRIRWGTKTQHDLSAPRRSNTIPISTLPTLTESSNGVGDSSLASTASPPSDVSEGPWPRSSRGGHQERPGLVSSSLCALLSPSALAYSGRCQPTVACLHWFCCHLRQHKHGPQLRDR